MQAQNWFECRVCGFSSNADFYFSASDKTVCQTCEVFE
jgi:hypothetical protein